MYICLKHQLCREGPGSPAGQRSWLWSSNVPLRQWKLMVPWAALGRAWPAGWERASVALVRTHLECCLWMTDMNILKLVHQSIKKRFKGLEHHFYDKRLRDLGKFILEKIRQKRGKRTFLEEEDFSGLLIKFTDSGCKTVSPVSLCCAAENMYTLWFCWTTL